VARTAAWLGLGVVVAASGVIYGGAPTSGVFSSGVEAAYPYVVVGLAGASIGLALAIGRAGKTLKLKGPIPVSAAVLILCTAAAVGFKVADARFGAIAFPQGAALTPKADCRTPDATQTSKGCGFGGFYVGEDSNWIYFVQTALVCPGMPQEPVAWCRCAATSPSTWSYPNTYRPSNRTEVQGEPGSKRRVRRATGKGRIRRRRGHPGWRRETRQWH
jgi:hypothetical protein